MAKKRAKVNLDFGDKTNLFAKTDPSKPKDQRRGRIMQRATYDLTPELKAAVSQRAYRLGIPASQLAMFLLCDALQRLDAGDIDPTPYLLESQSPKFRNNLGLGDWYHLGDNE
jgi:hypothetical protein